MAREINDRQKKALIAILLGDEYMLNSKRIGETLRVLEVRGFIISDPNNPKAFKGWTITTKGHMYLARVRKP